MLKKNKVLKNNLPQSPFHTLKILYQKDLNKVNYHIALASCIEMIHTATLLHDDVIDESKKRRTKISANYLWGSSASILVGDFLFSKSFVVMVNNSSKKNFKNTFKNF